MSICYLGYQSMNDTVWLLCVRWHSTSSVGGHHWNNEADVRQQLCKLYHQCFCKVSKFFTSQFSCPALEHFWILIMFLFSAFNPFFSPPYPDSGWQTVLAQRRQWPLPICCTGSWCLFHIWPSLLFLPKWTKHVKDACVVTAWQMIRWTKRWSCMKISPKLPAVETLRSALRQSLQSKCSGKQIM